MKRFVLLGMMVCFAGCVRIMQCRAPFVETVKVDSVRDTSAVVRGIAKGASSVIAIYSYLKNGRVVTETHQADLKAGAPIAELSGLLSNTEYEVHFEAVCNCLGKRLMTSGNQIRFRTAAVLRQGSR